MARFEIRGPNNLRIGDFGSNKTDNDFFNFSCGKLRLFLEPGVALHLSSRQSRRFHAKFSLPMNVSTSAIAKFS